MKKNIGEILLEEGLIKGEELEKALQEQTKTRARLASILVNLGYLSEDAMLKALSIQMGIPFLTLRDYPKIPPVIDPPLSIKFLKQYKLIPLEKRDSVLKVAMSDPLDSFAINGLRLATDCAIEPCIGRERDILTVIDQYYGGTVTMEKIIEGIEEKEMEVAPWQVEEEIEHLRDLAQEAPIINLVNLLITRAVERRASDIHIEPFEDGLHIRYRIDGILHQTESPPKNLHPAIVSRIKIMAKLNIAERRLPQDGRIKLKVLGKDIDIRVSSVPMLYGEGVVMRLLDPTGIIGLEVLGFEVKNRERFEDLIKKPYGMFLVTGPTGSGKTTTLYAALSMMNTREKKVITIEDPIEYYLEGVNQIQVKPKIGLTFADGLRSIVRQDPDIIMVGEIRDVETADIAIHAALTGHLVFSTLHTNDAAGAVTRLKDMGVEGYLISSSLLGVLAQRLVRVICNKCKITYAPDKELADELGVKMNFQTYKGKGCEICDHTGYKGRTGIFELLLVNDEIRRLIVEKKGSDVIAQKAIELGMKTLRDDGWEKVKAGITTVDEVIRVTQAAE
ncbi:MAG: type II secretion system protein GspE [Deltaproteobacteria bacterium GWF2_42_12]|nr:MAG: type II secretion system protein GspE [Deltaproteobacteria bacterium GWF2_42_12]